MSVAIILILMLLFLYSVKIIYMCIVKGSFLSSYSLSALSIRKNKIKQNTYTKIFIYYTEFIQIKVLIWINLNSEIKILKLQGINIPRCFWKIMESGNYHRLSNITVSMYLHTDIYICTKLWVFNNLFCIYISETW